MSQQAYHFGGVTPSPTPTHFVHAPAGGSTTIGLVDNLSSQPAGTSQPLPTRAAKRAHWHAASATPDATVVMRPGGAAANGSISGGGPVDMQQLMLAMQLPLALSAAAQPSAVLSRAAHNRGQGDSHGVHMGGGSSGGNDAPIDLSDDDDAYGGTGNEKAPHDAYAAAFRGSSSSSATTSKVPAASSAGRAAVDNAGTLGAACDGEAMHDSSDDDGGNGAMDAAGMLPHVYDEYYGGIQAPASSGSAAGSSIGATSNLASVAVTGKASNADSAAVEDVLMTQASKRMARMRIDGGTDDDADHRDERRAVSNRSSRHGAGTSNIDEDADVASVRSLPPIPYAALASAAAIAASAAGGAASQSAIFSAPVASVAPASTASAAIATSDRPIVDRHSEVAAALGYRSRHDLDPALVHGWARDVGDDDDGRVGGDGGHDARGVAGHRFARLGTSTGADATRSSAAIGVDDDALEPVQITVGFGHGKRKEGRSAGADGHYGVLGSAASSKRHVRNDAGVDATVSIMDGRGHRSAAATTPADNASRALGSFASRLLSQRAQQIRSGSVLSTLQQQQHAPLSLQRAAASSSSLHVPSAAAASAPMSSSDSPSFVVPSQNNTQSSHPPATTTAPTANASDQHAHDHHHVKFKVEVEGAGAAHADDAVDGAVGAAAAENRPRSPPPPTSAGSRLFADAESDDGDGNGDAGADADVDRLDREGGHVYASSSAGGAGASSIASSVLQQPVDTDPVHIPTHASTGLPFELNGGFETVGGGAVSTASIPASLHHPSASTAHHQHLHQQPPRRPLAMAISPMFGLSIDGDVDGLDGMGRGAASPRPPSRGTASGMLAGAAAGSVTSTTDDDTDAMMAPAPTFQSPRPPVSRTLPRQLSAARLALQRGSRAAEEDAEEEEEREERRRRQLMQQQGKQRQLAGQGQGAGAGDGDAGMAVDSTASSDSAGSDSDDDAAIDDEEEDDSGGGIGVSGRLPSAASRLMRIPGMPLYSNSNNSSGGGAAASSYSMPGGSARGVGADGARLTLDPAAAALVRNATAAAVSTAAAAVGGSTGDIIAAAGAPLPSWMRQVLPLNLHNTLLAATRGRRAAGSGGSGKGGGAEMGDPTPITAHAIIPYQLPFFSPLPPLPGLAATGSSTAATASSSLSSSYEVAGSVSTSSAAAAAASSGAADPSRSSSLSPPRPLHQQQRFGLQRQTTRGAEDDDAVIDNGNGMRGMVGIDSYDHIPVSSSVPSSPLLPPTATATGAARTLVPPQSATTAFPVLSAPSPAAYPTSLPHVSASAGASAVTGVPSSLSDPDAAAALGWSLADPGAARAQLLGPYAGPSQQLPHRQQLVPMAAELSRQSDRGADVAADRIGFAGGSTDAADAEMA